MNSWCYVAKHLYNYTRLNNFKVSDKLTNSKRYISLSVFLTLGFNDIMGL